MEVKVVPEAPAKTALMADQVEMEVILYSRGTFWEVKRQYHSNPQEARAAMVVLEAWAALEVPEVKAEAVQDRALVVIQDRRESLVGRETPVKRGEAVE
jgi:hypothetical protein